jgi:HAMP domain-containing protein
VSSNGVVQSARDSRVIGKPLGELGAEALAVPLTGEAEGSISGIPWLGRGDQVAAWSGVNDDLVSIILQPQDAFLSPIEELARTTWILFAVMAVIAFSLAVLIARRLSRPISVLTGSAVRIEAGEPLDPQPLAEIGSARDDVGRLARVFSRMAEQVAQRERTLREELRALRVEINQDRRQLEVSQITDSDFFRDLLLRAEELRRRMRERGDES